MLRKRCTVLLRPLSWLYGLGVGLRNFAFDCGILRERTYPVPIICVGNISVGGTGKTPHVEYILSLLVPRYRVAVISRGYKRKTKGMIVATSEHTASDIGDEPRQIKLKYPEVCLVVHADRRASMDYLMSLADDERPEVVVMDDGLQHRYVKPTYRIMLMDANRQLEDDHLLPEGLLREPATARYRMDCIIVTKCADKMKPLERRGIERSLGAYPCQYVAFSSIRYLPLRSVASLLRGADAESARASLVKGSPILALSGIASTKPFWGYLAEHYKLVDKLDYGDHHHFTTRDLEDIAQKFTHYCEQYPHLSIICTEKDAVRLVDSLESLPKALVARLYYLPIEIKVLERREELERLILLAAKAKPQPLQTV